MFSIIESKLTFFKVQVEGGFSHAAKLYESNFGKAPEAFDTVDVVRSDGKFVLGMVYAIVLLVAEMDYAVIRAKPVSMDG